MTYQEAYAAWRENIKPAVIERCGADDTPALAESWNNYTDTLCTDGEFTPLQYHYCPAWDDPIPPDGDAERDHILDSLGLTISAEFIPWSQSRNKAAKEPSLNWRVTLKCGTRDILTTDYSAGMVHCPAYSRRPPDNFAGDVSMWRRLACRVECEEGKPAIRWHPNDSFSYGPEKIQPDLGDVLYALLMDSDVLEHDSFEDWACNMGFDEDSRKAESVYRDCLGIALKMRNGLGDSTLESLRALLADY